VSLFAGEPSLSVEPGIALLCSARTCRANASWGLRWNNPKLHAPDRRKTWLACPDHRESLEAFLTVRGFLVETVPVGELKPDIQRD
jgi:hypothetical protein